MTLVPMPKAIAEATYPIHHGDGDTHVARDGEVGEEIAYGGRDMKATTVFRMPPMMLPMTPGIIAS